MKSKYINLYDKIKSKNLLHNNIKNTRWLFIINVFSKNKEVEYKYREYRISDIENLIDDLQIFYI